MRRSDLNISLITRTRKTSRAGRAIPRRSEAAETSHQVRAKKKRVNIVRGNQSVQSVVATGC